VRELVLSLVEKFFADLPPASHSPRGADEQRRLKTRAGVERAKLRAVGA